MSQERFDDLAKALASGVSRREALRKIGVGLAGAVLAGVGLRRAEAAQPHLCCTYFCKGEPTLVHKCIRRGTCESVAPVGCFTQCQQVVTKCSACGSLDCDFKTEVG